MLRHLTLFLVILSNSSVQTARASSPPVWSADRGDGTYRNPVLHADYSDPDAVRVGEDYWMVSSSFNHVPGLPVLHSRDLVNWELVGHALPRLVPDEVFSTPQHGKGVWAPAIRHHQGKFWIYYPDPDFGISVVTASNPRGPWSKPIVVKAGKGLIDPCPFWDENGKAYLVHAWAKSRAGISNRLSLVQLSDDGERVEHELGVIIDGDKVPVAGFRTLEGPKVYQRAGWYYIFAPAGGVEHGWQSVFRSRQLTGPYEHRIVLAQGNTAVNGPHQGALIDTPAGEWWFLHFQDKSAYGRVVHLQPVQWTDDWPVIGETHSEDGTGQPVMVHKKPGTASPAVQEPATSDEFDSSALGLQWQWQANPAPEWYSLTARPDHLRLQGQPETAPGNLYHIPSLLLQKFPAVEFVTTTCLDLAAEETADLKAGLIVFGYDYAWIGVRRAGGKHELVFGKRKADPKSGAESVLVLGQSPTPAVWLRVVVRAGGRCRFYYSVDGENFEAVPGDEFIATKGHWVGAKIGLFALGRGAADFASFRIGAIPQGQ